MRFNFSERLVSILTAAVLAVSTMGWLVTSGSSRALAAPGDPVIGVSPWTPWVGVSNFIPGETVTLSVDFTNNGSVDFSSSQVANSVGSVQFNTGSFSIRYNSLVTAVSATYSKTLLVPEVRVEYVNEATDVASGVGPASSSVLVTVEQAGPPLASAVVSTDSFGKWSHDFTSAYDIESNREVAAQVEDADGDKTRATWRASVPVIGVGYSQFGANSLIVSQFAPGTSVRMRVDFENDGGPLGGYDFDQTSVVDNQFAFGFNIGGFDLLHPGDELVATGGGWTKELISAPLRIEKADALTEVIGGVATIGDLVTVGISPMGGGGPSVITKTVTAGVGGVWFADFFADYDLASNQEVSADIRDVDGDRTFTTWKALNAYFSASVTDGPPSQVMIVNFVKGTQVRLQIDYGNNGTVDFDVSRAVIQTWGDVFNLGGSGLLNPGDKITVTGGGWTKNATLEMVSIDAVDESSDLVTGRATPGLLLQVDVNPPPGIPGPPVATRLVTAGASGTWSVSFQGVYDIVLNQQVVASHFDGDGDTTQALGWARDDEWSKSDLFSPIKNPPLLNVRKAGSTVPIKFSLDGYRGMGIFGAGFPKSSPVDCELIVDTIGSSSIETPGTGGLLYDADADTYEIKWRTLKEWRGTCRQLVILFADGTYLRANFRFN